MSGQRKVGPLKDKIGESLRDMYDEVLDEPVPDEFLDLLKKADSKADESDDK